MSVRIRRVVAALTAALTCGVMLTAGQQAPAGGGPYTAAQAASGRTAYEANCAACHGADLQGVPPLAGATFLGPWTSRTTPRPSPTASSNWSPPPRC